MHPHEKGRPAPTGREGGGSCGPASLTQPCNPLPGLPMDGGGPGPQLELKVERNPSHNVVTCVTVRLGGYFPAIKAFRLSLSYFFEKPELGSAVSGQCVSSSRSLSVRWLSGAYYLKVAAAVLSRPYTTSQALYKKNSFKTKPELRSPRAAPPLPYPPSPCPAAHARTGPLQPEKLGVARRRKN